MSAEFAIRLIALTLFLAAPGRLWADTFVLTDAADVSGGVDPPLRMPTDVAVDRAGNICVADANDRVVVIDNDGTLLFVIAEASGQALSRPTGVALDAGDRLWIADTGNRRAVCVRAGAVERVVDLRGVLATDHSSITDLAAPGDGLVLWLVDGGGHRVVRYDTTSGTGLAIGGRGSALGKFEYPFLIAAAPAEPHDLYVVDGLNGRVQIVSTTPAAVAMCGEYGLEIGQLYRPKGVAVDAAGLVWVSDGVLGVVQAFGADGRAMGVLRDGGGRPFRFDTPMGLAFDAAGRLYVAELRPGRIRRVTIHRDPGAAGPAPDRRSAPGARQPQQCTLCHMEWMAPLSENGSTELASPPPNSPQRPAASRGEVCLSCHDGSVADSRQSVWFGHGHATGVRPPQEMTVPRELPLVDGALDCRTCHSAHTRGGAGHSVESANFLRVEGEASALCASCHAGREGTGAPGMHPARSGGDWHVAEELVRAGAKVSHGEGGAACLTCHQAHGSRSAAMLVDMPSSRLCLSCHELTHAAAFGKDAPHVHPLGALGGAAGDGIVSWADWKPGDDYAADRLGCLSCHSMHHAAGEPNLLARTLRGSELCLVCHADHQPVMGGRHDLRTSAAATCNLAGKSAEEAGPCSACHGVHAAAVAPEPAPADPRGACSSCHKPGGIADAKTGRPFAHPTTVGRGALLSLATQTGGVQEIADDSAELTCTACHDPHASNGRDFLRGPADDVCASCHESQAATLRGAHDFTLHADARNARGATAEEAGRCGFCHAVHAPLGAALSVATAASPLTRDDACTQCHGADTSPVSAAMPPPRHPAGAAACAECHDPHGDLLETGLMRVSSDGDRRASCFECHENTRGIDAGPHGRIDGTACGPAATVCGPCHASHAPGDPAPRGSASETLSATGMWAGMPGPSGLSPAEQKCAGCHQEQGCARAVAYRPHPPLLMFEPEKPENLPLYGADGERSATGRIVCATCHDPHGPQPERLASWRNPTGDLAVLRASKPMLRTFTPPTVCTSCHGFDALRRFLYYHRGATAGPGAERGDSRADPSAKQ